MERAIRQYGLDPYKAPDLLNKKAKQRANYYNFYTNRRWGDADNYDLAFSSSVFGIEHSVKLIIEAEKCRRRD